MTETLLLERYRVVEKVAARLGGEASLAEDAGAGGVMVEVHVLPPSPQAEQAYPPVRQAIEQLRGVPAGPIARALDLTWGPDGELILVSEYHEGRTLADLVARGPLAPARAREVLRGVLHALAVARRVGLQHGGLSPWRVLVDPATEDRVVLLDLGVVALSAAPPDPREAPYRAPGDARGARADAFAVAVMALELLAGKQPGEAGRSTDVPAEAAAAVSPEFVKAIQALARADGSARAFDAGALLGLLPAKRRRTRRSRFTLRETWDGDIGDGTARLLQLGLRPEYRDRMPAEIQGTGRAELEDEGPAPDIFVTPSSGAFQRDRMTPRTQPEVPCVQLAPEPVKLQPPTPPEPPKPDSSPFAVASAQARGTVPPPPPPPPRPPRDLLHDVDRGLEDDGGALTVPIPAPTPTQPAVPAQPVVPATLVLRAAHGKLAHFLVAPKDGYLDLGRERGNDVILRAFKGTTIENVDSNRISRKHLFMQRTPPLVTVADGQREGPTKASVYGSTLDGAKLPVDKRGAEFIGRPTPLPVGKPFDLVLATTTCRLEGRVLPGSCAVRLQRKDVGHHYVVVWGTGEVTLGSGEAEDALLLPPDGGVVPGHARLSIDLARGVFQVTPHNGALKLGGRDVPRGTWVALDGSQKLQVGAMTYAMRPAADQDFLVVGADIVMPA